MDTEYCGFEACRWSNHRSIVGGLPAYVRRNESIGEQIISSRPVVLMIYLVFRYKGVEGLPTYRSELDAAGQFEEKVAREIESKFNGVFALAVTHDGTRDLFFWMPAVPDDSVIEQSLEALSPPIDFDFVFSTTQSGRLITQWECQVIITPTPKNRRQEHAT